MKNFCRYSGTHSQYLLWWLMKPIAFRNGEFIFHLSSAENTRYLFIVGTAIYFHSWFPGYKKKKKTEIGDISDLGWYQLLVLNWSNKWRVTVTSYVNTTEQDNNNSILDTHHWLGKKYSTKFESNNQMGATYALIRKLSSILDFIDMIYVAILILMLPLAFI